MGRLVGATHAADAFEQGGGGFVVLVLRDELTAESLFQDGLAQRVGLSATPCTERVRRMEREGVITGYHARVDPHALGRALLVFVELKLSAKSNDAFDRVKKELAFVPEVMECHLVSGDFDYLIKARIAEMSDYRRLLGNILLKLPSATESRSYVVMEEVKESLYLPPEL